MSCLPFLAGLRRETCHHIALAVLVLLCLGCASPASAQDRVSLRLDWTTLGYHAPFYYGVTQGYYKYAGLDVRVEEGKGSSTSIALAGNNADDFAFADATTAAKLISGGLPVKVVMGIFQRSTLSLFFRKGTMSSPKDLMGKRISMCAGDGMSIYLPAYLKAIDLKPSDVRPLTLDCSVKYTVIAQGQADAVASYGTAGRPLMQAIGISDVDKFDFADAGVTLPSHGLITSRDKIKSNPDVIRRFVAATARAWDEARKNPDAAVAATIAARPLLQGKEALLKATLLESLQYLGSTEGKPMGWQSPDDWRRAEDTLVEFAGVTRTAPENIYTNDFR
jgi:NitT/TauT family transport system substrate-binding protein